MSEHGPSGLDGYVSMQCLVGLPGCDDAGCVCACHDQPNREQDAEPRCGLAPGQYGTCLCTGRAGCQATNDDLPAEDEDL